MCEIVAGGESVAPQVISAQVLMKMKDAAENPDSYVALRVKREKEERERRVANRSCTYCSGKGHNRRGCKVLKADKAAVLDKLRAYRDKFAKAMSDSGFGIGALIELPDGGWREMGFSNV